MQDEQMQNNEAERPYLKFGLILAVLVIILDQLSKWWILEGFDLPTKGSVNLLPFLNFTMVWNENISMGIPLFDYIGKWGIVAFTSAIMLWLIIWLKDSKTRFETVALAFVIGGAVGNNLIDRIIHGAVVDFIHFHGFGYSFYVFNIADTAISVGVAMLLIDGLRGGEKSPKNAPIADQDGQQDSQGHE